MKKELLQTMKIIDAHAHIFPKKIETVATDAIGVFYETPMAHMGSIEELLAAGTRAGVTDYLVFSTATTPQQVTKINDFILETCAERPEFMGAGTMHREFEGAEDEIDRIFEAGLRGVKFHPDFQKFNIDDEKLFPVFARLEQKGMFFITHSGDYRYTYSHPARVANIAKKYPRLRVVAAHFGGWSQWDVARRDLAPLPNVYVDTSSTFGFTDLDNVRASLAAFNKKHIFFGCDFPMWDHAGELETLRALGLDDGVLEDILYRNFERFYG
ncbi:MAG: amidohydrolase [Oscillospiraceae bacterium]|nr:amidohydrolase [Oscillospiraceae bacterium]